MNVKILLPYGIFLEKKSVLRVHMETISGNYGLLPNRLDCAAALTPGILMYETSDEGSIYVAIDEGVMVKTGTEVTISVRNAMGGTDLGKLHEFVKKEFLNLDEKEKSLRTAIAKLESGFIHYFDKAQIY